jgi:hypothetical protein
MNAMNLIKSTIDQMVSPAETATIIQGYVNGRRASADGKQLIVTEDDAKALVNWAKQTRAMNAMLDGILAGDIFPDVINGEITFSLTAAGKDHAKAVVEGTHGS